MKTEIFDSTMNDDFWKLSVSNEPCSVIAFVLKTSHCDDHLLTYFIFKPNSITTSETWHRQDNEIVWRLFSFIILLVFCPFPDLSVTWQLVSRAYKYLESFIIFIEMWKDDTTAGVRSSLSTFVPCNQTSQSLLWYFPSGLLHTFHQVPTYPLAVHSVSRRSLLSVNRKNWNKNYRRRIIFLPGNQGELQNTYKVVSDSDFSYELK